MELPARRAELLLEVMSLDDKLALMHGGEPNNSFGIPRLKLNDGPAGITGPDENTGTQLPAPIALAASFSPEYAYRYGKQIGREGKSRETSLLLGPTVNIARSPLNGRTFEAYGEDPFLAARTGVEVVKGIQDQGVMTCVKHYAVNNQEEERFTQNSIVDERTLREIYLPAFEAVVREGGASSLMASYNQINGVHGAENRDLLQRILKHNWAFEGFVVSDFLATQSTVASIHAGLDYELTFPHKRYFGEPLKEAVKSGLVSLEAINESVERILKEMFTAGLFERAESNERDASNGEVLRLSGEKEALEAAIRSIVLLKNEKGVLPLNQKSKIAVFGQAAAEGYIASGGGSAYVPGKPITPLEGIRKQVGSGVEVTYRRGTTPVPMGPSFMYDSPNVEYTIPAEAFSDGLVVYTYPDNALGGEPIDRVTVPNLCVNWELSGKQRPSSARWVGKLIAPMTADYTFYLPASGGARLFLEGELLLDNWDVRLTNRIAVKHMVAGEAVDLEVHYTSDGAPAALASIALEWYPNTDESYIQEAVQCAEEADYAIIVVNDYMTENYDKPNLDLPGAQNSLIAAVASSNPNTIVVLNTGGPVAMPWLNEVQAVVAGWYGGINGGDALAQILFGNADPSGRLPITFPMSIEESPVCTSAQYPGLQGDTVYSEKLEVGYRGYLSRSITPLFPFGHGLSYTSFDYHDLHLQMGEPDSTSNQSVVTAIFKVTNTGDRSGTVVPQLYVEFPLSASEPSPVLRQYTSLELQPGESVTIELSLGARAFAVWEPQKELWKVPNGSYTVRIGDSFSNLSLQASVQSNSEWSVAANASASLLTGMERASTILGSRR
ncbi:glycoside hydrolase family 3 C-terminal domain-containing protein [Paenibacillus sp. ACRSA]|uniref:beta-glucosidase n=1 Tax=Paenibacillus sp. ACRSA TaxID=2918211 RepID=UPI001EF5599E|nr:glycoside hydrolase family 3 C-terminal domain-containing protein [Paenibacillus sp. ACRSA]MCG7378759.1 glycoside hydrolase family 3 C-terminal domain-containing protein [Paenibacillus sp. ACRSA]